MDYSLSGPSHSLDGSEEFHAPLRSPSRLDFCMDEGDDLLTERIEWSCIPIRSEFSSAHSKADASAAPPSDPPRLLFVDRGRDDPRSDTHDIDTPGMFFAPPEQTDQMVFEPQAPTPVRPPSVQIHIDAQESMPPSYVPTRRLNYPHHGFSRSALLQRKTFWNSRHEEWLEWQSRMQQGKVQKHEFEINDAYTGLTSQPRNVMGPPPYMRSPSSGLERDLADHPPRQHGQDLHASIYPRVGDISALRDPYSVNIDRSFFRLPLWTLHKTLYAFDMQQRSASLVSSPSAPNAVCVHTSSSSSTLSSYSPSTSGGDEESDSTLVADDGPFVKSHRPLDPLIGASSPHSSPFWNRFCEWELSWYARWELLLSIFRHNHSKFGAFDRPAKAMPFGSTTTTSSAHGQIFRFTVEEDEGGSEDYEDDEVEDYGTLVANSSFSVDFEEECERALAFYSRELKSLEVAM